MCVGETGRKWVGGRSTGRRDALRSFFFVLPSSRFCDVSVLRVFYDLNVLRLYGSMFLVVFGFTVLRFRHFLIRSLRISALTDLGCWTVFFLLFCLHSVSCFFVVFAFVAEFTVVFFVCSLFFTVFTASMCLR